MVEASQISGYEGTVGRVKMTGFRVNAGSGGRGRGGGAGGERLVLATEWVQLKYDYIGPKTSPTKYPKNLQICWHF